MVGIQTLTRDAAIHCDKCGRIVWDSNNAVLVDAEVEGFTLVHLMAYGRHFMPVYHRGVKVCEGSPSRAQYIARQPRDTRGYRYRKEHEPVWREAYRRVQLKYRRGYTP